MSEAVANRLEEVFSIHKFQWRETAFRAICQHLLELNRPVTIVETGSMRPPREPGLEFEDGQSTLIWDAIAEMTCGEVWSVDISEENVRYGHERTKNVKFVCGDSLRWLSSHDFKSKIDLLYLDSVDFKQENAAESCLHHAGELACATPHLNKGAIVAVDDCLRPFMGKHALVRMFIEMIAGIPPSGLGYVCWWRMPE